MCLHFRKDGAWALSSSREVQLEGDEGTAGMCWTRQNKEINPCSVFADLGSMGRCKCAHWGKTIPNSCSKPCFYYPATGARKMTFSPFSVILRAATIEKTPRKLGLANICKLSFPSASLLPAACFSPAPASLVLPCFCLDGRCEGYCYTVLLLQMQTESFQNTSVCISLALWFLCG